MTVVNCMSPTGHFISPLLVFPRKYIKQELMNYTAPGSIHACHSSGWIQNEIFTQWFLHFIKYTMPTKKDPVILVLDGHYSHTRNVEVITLARENHAEIICLPPQNSHKMYPRIKLSWSPSKKFYSQETEIYLRPSLGRASCHRLPNWRTVRQCTQASCNRRDSG